MIVIASLAGLFAFGDPTFTSLAIGGIATVLVALAAGLTLVPALLGVVGAQDQARGAPASRRRVLRPAGPPGATPPGHRRGRRGRHPAGGRPCRSWRGTTSNGDPRTLPTSFESRAVERPARRELPRHPGRPDPGRRPDPGQRPARRRLRRTDQAAARGRRRHHRAGPDRATCPRSTSSPPAPRRTPPPSGWSTTCAPTRRAYRTYVTGTAAFLIDFEQPDRAAGCPTRCC